MKSAPLHSLLSMYLMVGALVVKITCDPTKDILQLVAMVSVPPDGNHCTITQDWERGLEILPGARVAVQEVNRNTDILPGYQLELVELITEGCSGNLALVQLVQHLVTQAESEGEREIPIVGVIGPLCSEAVELVASVAGHPEISLVQIGAGPSLIAKDRNDFPYLFQMLPLGMAYINMAFELMELFSWSRVAVVCSMEQDGYDCRTAEVFQKRASERGVEVVFFGTAGSGAMTCMLNYLRKSGANIMFAFIPPSVAGKLVCAANRQGLTWPDYVWILPGISSENLLNSTVCDDGYDMEGLLTLELDEDKHIHEDVGGNKPFYSAYHDELNETASRNRHGNPYALVMYDSVWAFARALDGTIRNGSKVTSSKPDLKKNVAENITAALLELSFQGAFGHVHFDSHHNQIHVPVQVKQVINGVSTCIGRYNPHNKTTTVRNTGDFPPDQLGELYQKPPFSMLLALLVILCIVFTTAMFLLYVCYRGAPEIKATSTSISLFMFLGCYLQLFSALINIVNDRIIVYGEWQRAFFCNVDVWMGTLGFIFILATLLARLLRVYRVFTHFGKTGRACSDGSLCILILCLVLVEVFILILWTSVDTFHRVDVSTFNKEGEPPYYEVEQVCECEYLGLWAVLLFSYGSLLLMALLVLAVKTRKIQRGNFKDTKKVNILLFSYMVIRAITISIWTIFRDTSPSLSNAAMLLTFMLTALFCQVLLFLPKTLPPLWRQVQENRQIISFLRTVKQTALINRLFGIWSAEDSPA